MESASLNFSPLAPTSRSDVKLSNVKLSCLIKLDKGEVFSIDEDEVGLKRCSNFLVVKRRFVYTIFKTKKNARKYHINITKIPSEKEINDALSNLNRVIKSKFCILHWRKENITCSINTNREIPLFQVFSLLKKQPYVKKLKFIPDRFPAMFVSMEQNTVLMFSTGKMVIIGGKTKNDALNSVTILINFLQRHIYKCDMTPTDFTVEPNLWRDEHRRVEAGKVYQLPIDVRPH